VSAKCPDAGCALSGHGALKSLRRKGNRRCLGRMPACIRLRFVLKVSVRTRTRAKRELRKRSVRGKFASVAPPGFLCGRPGAAVDYVQALMGERTAKCCEASATCCRRADSLAFFFALPRGRCSYFRLSLPHPRDMYFRNRPGIAVSRLWEAFQNIYLPPLSDAVRSCKLYITGQTTQFSGTRAAGR
jgi:hypothetical protein